MSGNAEIRVDYQLLLDTLTVGFALYEIICDESGEPYDYRFLMVNSAYEYLSGMKKEDVLGRNYSELFPNGYISWLEECGAIAISGKPAKLEIYLPDLKRYYEVTAYQPAPGQLAVILIDISKRKRFEEDLLKSRARDRELLDSLPDRILHIAEDGTFLDCRAPPKSDLHSKSDLFLGKKMQEVLPSSLADLAAVHMRRARESGALQTFEYRMNIGDKELDYEARVSVCPGGGFIFLVRDISKQKRIEEAFLESDRRFREAVDSVPYSFMIFDEKLRFRYVNQAAVEMIGRSEEEIFGRTSEDILFTGAIGPYTEHLKRVLETKSVQRTEYTYDLPSGMIAYSAVFVPLFNELCDVEQILGISHDITKRKEAEIRLKSILDENRRQNRLLKTVVEEMKGNYDEIERLLYTITHDLMAPLVTIDGFLGLLKKDVEKCNRVRIEIDMGLISDAVNRMKVLLSRAMELSSLGMLSGAAERIPFEEIVDAARMHFKNTGSWSDLVISEDKDFPSIYINRKRIEDVLASMIEGCIRCSGESQSPEVHVGWRMDDECAVLFTRCKGTRELKDAAEAFRLCTDEECTDNCTSIGLAISKRIIQLQGGRMWMECGPEVGCTILFTLPEKEKSG